MKKFLKGFGIFCLVLFVLGFISRITLASEAISESMMGVTVAAVVAVFWGCIRFAKDRREHGRQKKAEKERHRENQIAGAAPVITSHTRHVAGLPVASGVPITAEVFTTKLSLTAGGQNFQVPMDRIMGAQMYTDTEMRQHIESSLFQTVLGGAAFGAAGAIIGAMPESKYRREISKYNVLITYLDKDGKDAGVVLSSDTSLAALQRAVQSFHKAVNVPKTTTL